MKQVITVNGVEVPGEFLSNQELGWADMPVDTTGVFYALFKEYGTQFGVVMPPSVDQLTTLATKLRKCAWL